MQRKIYSQTLKRAKLVIEKNSSANSWGTIKDFVVTLGAASGIIGGVLWMGGRFFAYGYFERMNIPLYFLSFSAGEYTEVYLTTILLRIILFFTTNLPVFLSIIFLSLVTGIVLWLIQKRYKKLKLRDALVKIENINNKSLIISLIVLFFTSFFVAYSSGDAAAQYSLMNSRAITVYSSDMLPLGTTLTAIETNQQDPLFEYTGLYLLTRNNGKYYLFRELDAATCRPKQIYIVADSDLISVNIGESISLPKCSATP